jgi:hypothetical protein
MVEAGGVGGRLREALGFVENESYAKAARSLLVFSEEVGGEVLSPGRGKKLAVVARKIVVMMIGG